MPDAEPDDKVRRLACLRYGIFYAGSYFDSGRPAPRVLEDLVQSHSLVSLPRIHGTEAANAWGRWYDIVDRAKQPVAVVEWASVSERLVMSGSALALLPVYTPCLHPSLRELPLDDEPIHLDLWKVTRHGAERRADVCAISDKLIQAFAEVDWETNAVSPAPERALLESVKARRRKLTRLRSRPVLHRGPRRPPSAAGDDLRRPPPRSGETIDGEDGAELMFGGLGACIHARPRASAHHETIYK